MRAEEPAAEAAKPAPEAAKPAGKPAAPAAEKGAAVEKFLRSIKADGPVVLNDVVQADLLSIMPPRASGECAVPPVVTPAAFGLKARGDGPMLVARVVDCKGGTIRAVSPA